MADTGEKGEIRQRANAREAEIVFEETTLIRKSKADENKASQQQQRRLVKNDKRAANV